MDLRKLEHFLAVAKHGQISLAAEANGVSQQAVSQAVMKLEFEFGVPLFERHAYGVRLNHYGRALQGRAEAVLAEHRLAISEIHALRNASAGNLRLGVGATLSSRLVADVIRDLRQRMPQVRVDTSVELSRTLYAKLLRGDLDCVACVPVHYERVPDELSVERLFDEHEHLVVRAGHPLTRHTPGPVELASLTEYPWLVASQPEAFWERILARLRDAQTPPPDDVVKTDSSELFRALLRSEDYVGVTTRSAMEHDLAAGTAVLIEVPQLQLTRSALIAYRSSATLHAAAREFIRLLRQACGSRSAPSPSS